MAIPVKIRHLSLLLALALLASFCHPAKKTSGTATLPPSKEKPAAPPKFEPMDTIRWHENPAAAPPIGAAGQAGSEPSGGDFSRQNFRVALLLPFLTHQADTAQNGVPEKSRLALQFYAGARLALEKLSSEEGMNLTVDVHDTKIADADFEKLLADPKLDLAQVFVGPIRSSHVAALAKRTKLSRKILISPESPNPDLTIGNPNFIQLNPSLRVHCQAIVRHVLRDHAPEDVVLVCKQKESERLGFLREANAAGASFREIVVPDAAENFSKIDLAPYFRAGRATVFIMPSWASQDFVFSFLRRVKIQQGRAQVAIFGMPQWAGYGNIEPEYFQSLNVHISAASFVDFGAPALRDFQRKFYDATGTIPDDDAINGYDTMLFTGMMLKKYGLDFPERLSREAFVGLHGQFRVGAANALSSDDWARANYLENKFVHILKFENQQFRPIE